MAALKAEAGMADHLHFNERSRHGRFLLKVPFSYRMVGSVASVASHARAGVVRGVGIAQTQGPRARQGQFQLSPPLSYFDLGNTAA
jgi:hypothetical protein